MTARSHVRALLVTALMAGCAMFPIASVSAASSEPSQAMTKLLDYARNQNSTGFLIVQDGKVLVEKHWPAPEGDRQFAMFVYGKNRQGALLEDVASQQKSFISVLIAIAIDKGLIDVEKPVAEYLGAGWSKATAEQEAKIRVIDVLTMSSGLNDKFGYQAPAGTLFYYNTPVYAVTKRILAAAAKQPLDTITREWLTAPAGMNDTAWRKRPAALASVGNDTGLVTSPHDTALFGLMVLHGGLANDGKRIVSEANLHAMFTPSSTNPAYGRLWWLNGSKYTLRALAGRKEGPLIPAAPADTVAAFGAFDRRLYVVPSLKLVVVRTGATAGDKDFDQQLWMRMLKVINPTVASTSAATPVVHAPGGPVRGVLVDGQHVFKGIPYALPPVGERRWKPPVEVSAWSDVRDATHFGPACQQPSAPPGSIYAETYPAMSEDCLSLNIWAPAESKNAPVFVWIHGGNLIRGSSQQPMFDGSQLAKRGIVVVSINYRLGVFGYFAHRELSAESPDGISGNYGVLDQIAALHWIKRNIAAFGGDTANVTIAGESAGGLAILHLLASPRAHGLYAKAIVQSASLMNIPDLKREQFGLPSAEALGERFATAMGAKGMAELRALDSQTITTLATQARFAATAVVDGNVLPRQLVETFDRGEQARVPLMTGFTSGEIRTMRTILNPPPPPAAQFDTAKYEATLRKNYAELADTFLKHYPATNIEESILAAARDGFFAWTSQRLVRNQAALGVPTYLYYFDHGYPAADDAGMHAFHAAEVPYMFGTIDRTTTLWPKIPDTNVERDLSAAMVEYWVSFAKTGVPSARNQPDWPSHNKAAAYMVFAGKPQVAVDLMPEQYRLHEQVVCRRRAAGNIPWNWNVGVTSPPLPAAQETCQ